MKKTRIISRFSRLSVPVELSITFDDVLHTGDPYCFTQKASERFIQAAKNLSVNDYLCFQLETDCESNFQAFVFSSSDKEVTPSDFDWIFQECAKSDTISVNVNVESHEIPDKVYALMCTEKKKKSHSLYEHSTSRRTKENISEIVAALKRDGTTLYMFVNGKGQGIIVISLPEAMTLRMQTMLSLAFSNTQVKEIRDHDLVLDNMSFLPSDNIMDFMSGILNYMIENRPIDDSYLLSNYELDNDSGYDESQIFVEDDMDSLNDGVPIYIEDMNLSVRAYNCLRRAGIHTIAELREKTDEELMHIRNLGRKSYEEVKDKLSKIPMMASSLVRSAPTFSEMLDELIGLESVKEQVRKITAYARMKKEMESNNKKSDPIVLNMQFVGNPGTAKTTVARITAGILHEIGLLKSNEIVEVGRANLVAGYVGQTAEKVKSVFKEAKGKLLFIDEAYSLLDSYRGSYGDEAISTIVQEMENNRNNTVVIFAGYSDEMSSFFSQNPGLRSRVPFTVRFPDYSVDEMVHIIEYETNKRGFSISPMTKEKLASLCKMATQNRESGNGRFCRNLVENAILNYAFRVYGAGEASTENDYSLEPSDFDTQGYMPSNNVDKPLHIGFLP